ATIGAALENVAAGDVLELPGSSVSNVSFGTKSLMVTTTGTGGGSYDFTNVNYAYPTYPVTGFTAALDPTTGLEAITFVGPDVFSDSFSTLWSNPLNWSEGRPPATGQAIVISAGNSEDDLTTDPAPSSLSLAAGAVLTVDNNLTVGVLSLAAGSGIGASNATLTIAGSVVGAGSLSAGGASGRLADYAATDPGEDYSGFFGGTVLLAATPATTSVFEYGPGTSTIALSHPGATIGAALEFVAAGDVLELPGTAVQNVTFGASSLQVTTTGTGGGSYDFTNVNYSSPVTDYTAAFDPTTELEAITFEANPPCYCRGTLIRTNRGQTTVERLKIGDKIMTMSGAARAIKWIGRRSYGGRFVMGRKDVLPVCIRAGALADNLPRRDLWISPHHAMYLEGVLIEAKDLVNGVSIVQAEHVEKVEYFHIELDTHDVLIAEGALSESFIDDDSRGMFHNAHEYRALYPDELAPPAQYFAPRHEDGYEVEAARRRIALRAGLLRAADAPRIGPLRGYVDLISPGCIAGWAQSTESPEAPVCLDIFAGGQMIGQTLANRHREDLQRAGLGSGNHSFEFMPPTGLAFASHAVGVRRPLDGAPLARSNDALRSQALGA
ncbi:MAG: Hint domain-containing protein, partial [Xanthobacteraceae bacterium]